MKAHILLTITMVLLCFTAKGQQDTIYLDSTMKQVKKRSKATECAVIQSEENGIKLVNFYSLNGKLQRSSEYKQFGKKREEQVLHGATSYKFSNSPNQDSLTVFYTNNTRNGGATFYYPTGEVMAKALYKNGQLNGPLQQYYENGKTKRIEIYEKNRSRGGKYFAPDSTLLDFTPFYKGAEYTDGELAMGQLISRYMQPTTELLDDMFKHNINKVNATIGIVVNAEGQAVDFIILSTENPEFNETCYPNMLNILNERGFIPGEIDGKKVTTLVAIGPIWLSFEERKMEKTYIGRLNIFRRN
ncbi:toxin-antitoxin system YwqK family antitoxin [Bacteroides heparinolyticus]|uniref:toxin-antitoxin system YwqK family antitoxin n=3 Tax=Prevotella heparinolytica TaxID=28113 RepID=UPI0035A15FD7